MPPSLIIVDDFLSDPHAFRAHALALDYDPKFKKGNYPGLLSTRPLPINGLDAEAGKRAGAKLQPAAGTTHQHCRLTLKGDKGISGVHVDPCFYSGILYLTLPEHCRGGTEFFRHKPTGLDRVPATPLELASSGYSDVNILIDEVVNGDTLKPARWERTMTVPMRFNRLILFSPWMFHNSAPGFGDRPENGRLVHLMFFAAAAQ
ncbi:DUF6445 family protein [Sphingomonas sp. AOB5]|uniref:DUF6445 family protein n=1 Tax=Sphingomonas sp. AOB5 TaxID=3034017 RepID=UPI0023F62ED0|nr:DUF6445 family protein [Sphingomonas sp. AOB5]MDF7774159.1 DUF6445 family protein [Sphingomonas sp. AOB5]